MSETLKQIVEDTLLLAANIRTGADIDEALSDSYGAYRADERVAAREFRIVELVINIAERIVAVSGIEPETVWTPMAVNDLLDREYSMRSELGPRVRPDGPETAEGGLIGQQSY